MQKILISILLLAFAISINAVEEPAPAKAVTDTTFMGVKVRQRSSSWQDYNPERGYFQKAFSDKGDPRFMIANEDDSFEFGIGGTLRMTGFSDFDGATLHNRFSVWAIDVPTYKKSHVSINVATSKLFVKSKAKIGGNRLISYLELKADEENKITLGKAYLSYGGFTAGQTYSFFMDLAAGVQTVDLLGPNTSVDKTHALVGYSFNAGNWDFGVAAERPDYKASLFSDLHIRNDMQPMPDFAARVSYKNKFGHIQLSGLARSLAYWSLDRLLLKSNDIELSSIESLEQEGSSKHEFGYGVALSGRINFTDKFFTSFQAVHGKGIHSYINDLGDTQLDLVPKYENDYFAKMQRCYRMKALPITGGYIGLQYNWSEKLTSSMTFGEVYMDIDNFEEMDWNTSYEDFIKDAKMIDTKNMTYFAVNVFYNINNFCTVGAEFLNGMRWQQNRTTAIKDSKTGIYHATSISGKTRGVANRFDLMFSYSF